jgi:ribosomal protein S18 acetylase RimI-like enzyme
VRWPDDESAIRLIDQSFATDTILAVSRDGFSFVVREEKVSPRYERARHEFDMQELRDADAMFAAEVEGEVVGIGGVRSDQWSRRGIVWNLYVHRPYRGRRAGHGLIAAIAEAARAAGMERLWLETQNVNLPAIRFYEREGFTVCGLDQSFYDSDPRASRETAMFFVKALTDR